MECVAVMAVASGLIFARLAQMQELNPFLWGFLGMIVYFGVPGYMIWRGADLWDLPLVWISPLVGLFVLFIIQSVVAAYARHKRR